MKIVTENGVKRYVLKKWTATRVVFWLSLAFGVFTAVFSIVKFALGGESGGQLFHDAGLCLAAAALLFLPAAVEKFFKWYIPNPIVMAAYLIVVLNLVGGEVWHLFDEPLKLYDKLMHTFNGVVFMFFGFSLVGMLNKLPEKNKELSPFFCVLFALGFAMLIEYVWEIYEYTLDSISEMYNMQRWKDGLIGLSPNGDGYYESTTPRGSAIADTMGDMIVHIMGALPVAIVGFCEMRLKGWEWLMSVSVLSKRQVRYFSECNRQGDEERSRREQEQAYAAVCRQEAAATASFPPTDGPENGGEEKNE